jgi:hypothetical protein
MGLLMLMGDSGAAFSGALDTLGTGLESAWSVGRRLRTGYTSNIIRVRRSSDNAEQDFGYLASGAVDAAAVAAFCGAGNGFLTTIYDQSGSGRNLVQATTANQPLVVSSGVAQTQNGRLWAVFDGSTSSRRMTVSSSTAHYKSFHDGTSSTLYCVLNATNDANFKSPYGNTVSGTDVGFRCYLSATEQPYIAAQNAIGEIIGAQKTQVVTTNVMTVFYDADNATAASREEGWLDGTLMTGDNALTGTPSSANATRDFNFGSAGAGSFPWNGAIGELVLWSADQTANRSVWESSAKTFWGTP